MANFIEEIRESLPTNSQVHGITRMPITYEEIALKLLNEKLLLTALELYVELCEAGKELPILRDFFSNANNFESQNVKPEPYVPMPRSSSQATLDSLDMTRYSEDGVGVDERVAVLEFELRKARDNISALRANLTVVTESEGTTPHNTLDKNLIQQLSPIKPHEQRALNFLVNEYLLACSYKLTSITFSDENENQDFEDWQDVGLNIPKPAELLQIYREYMRANGYDKPSSISVAVQTDLMDLPNEEEKQNIAQMILDIQHLEEQNVILEKEKADLQNIISSTNTNLIHVPTKEGSIATIQTMNSTSTTPDKFELLESPAQDTCNVVHEPGDNDSVSIVVSLGETDPGEKEWTRIQFSRMDGTDGPCFLLNSPSRQLPESFKTEVTAHCLVNIPGSIISSVKEPFKNGVNRETLVEILVKTLPRIVPNVILNKREEVIPLLLSAIRLHSDSSEREKLIHLLFNLKKRPQEDERQMILAGLIVLARLEDEALKGEEILTLCWEQSQHKYPEKRLFAVECCSVLAPYTSADVRNSLMLSMLQQMLLDDKDPAVRACVVRSLALLVALMDDPDKYFQCEELALTGLHDVSHMVVEIASSVLLPILAQWALTLKRLQSHLIPRIISKVKSQLSNQYSQNRDITDEQKIVPSIIVLQYLIPHTIVCIADSETVRDCIEETTSSNLSEKFLSLCSFNIINPQVFYKGDIDVGILLNTLVSNDWGNISWPEMEWLNNKLIVDIVEIVKSVEVAQENIINALLVYVRSICLGFGQRITQSMIQPIFTLEIAELEKQLTTLSTDKKNMCLTLIPMYLIMLSTLNGTEVSKSLKQFLVFLSMSGTKITCLRIAVIMLCNNEEMQEFVLGGLWDGVVHQRASVRCAAASLFGCIIPHVSDRLANSRIVPAIVTLANDPDITVRAAVIPALGRLITECKIKEAQDKARLTIETISRDSQNDSPILEIPLVSTLAVIIPNCPQNYVEDVITSQLRIITTSASHQSRKSDLANALVEAYSVLVYSPLSNHCVSEVLLPGLKQLEMLVNQSLPQQKETIRSLVKEVESRQELSKPMERSLSMSSGLSLSMASVNVGQGVEDMRQRVSKIFQQKANSPSMPSIFRKK